MVRILIQICLIYLNLNHDHFRVCFFSLEGTYDKTNLSSVNMGIPVDLNVEANDTGRLETAPWSINHIALGDAHQSGWCCY